MTFLRNAVLAVGMMSFAACGGSSDQAETTPAANPCGENPCGEEAVDDGMGNPCGDDMANPCGDDMENPCGENPCGDDMGDDMEDMGDE